MLACDRCGCEKVVCPNCGETYCPNCFQCECPSCCYNLMSERIILRTEYGVEIPCDSSGNPPHDAPGKYSQSAAAMGGETAHK